MENLTKRQREVARNMQGMVKTAPWVLRITESKKVSGPVLVISERYSEENGKTRRSASKDGMIDGIRKPLIVCKVPVASRRAVTRSAICRIAIRPAKICPLLNAANMPSAQNTIITMLNLPAKPRL